MVPAKFEQVKKGIVKRTEKRLVGLFIDGTGLDRATRRISRKVDMAALVRGVTSGLPPAVARYYTLIPYEDDARQLAFLDAVNRAGLSVVVKRLPPKGVNRQVSVDIEMAADIAAFALGHNRFGQLNLYRSDKVAGAGAGAEGTAGNSAHRPILRPGRLAYRAASAAGKADANDGKNDSPENVPGPEGGAPEGTATADGEPSPTEERAALRRVVTVVCPGRDLSYPIALARELGADTVTADFGQFSTGDILKSAAKWIDLSDSETIWRD